MESSLQPEAHLGRFKLSAFRPGQREVIAAVLAGQDCLCIMPTGGGKSLCYQLPAVARPGLTLVVSPLIALMKDQVDALTRNGIPATCINSNIDFDEQQARLEAVQAGRYSLLYVAPERFRNQRFVEIIAALKPQLLAIDEAHCVSEWGHDFRPDYARIAGFRRRVGNPQTIALTATATPHVRQDVMALLELRTPAIFITGFARPNLRFEVTHAGGMKQKLNRLIELLNREPGSGIIYASTRKRCSEVADAVRQATRRKVGVYHAGMDGDERRQVQDQFMSDRLDLIVATNAFGMGIDKPDLRLVVHFNMPGSLEAYYQEAGRAGRDGKPSRCVLLFASSDRHVQEFFIENSHPSAQTIEQVYDFLRRVDADPIELTQEQIKEQARLDAGAEAVGASEQVLARAGAIERLESRQNMAAVKLNSELPTLVDLLPPGAKVLRKVLRALEQLVGDRRHERVFFHPRQLAERTEMEPTAIARSLREVGELEAVDYVPPFRGRAVHMLIRDKSFDELGIDLTALEERRGAEYAKLDRMERYCRTGRCRQWEVLDYFGDPAAAACGTCDNCVQYGSAKARGGRDGKRASPRDTQLEVQRKGPRFDGGHSRDEDQSGEEDAWESDAPAEPVHRTSPPRDPLAREHVPPQTPRPQPAPVSAALPVRATPAAAPSQDGFDWRSELKGRSREGNQREGNQREGEAPAEPARRTSSSREETSPSSASHAGQGSAGASPSLGSAGASPSLAAPPGSLAETVLIALSGVARAKGRFGKQVIALMLGGSKSAKMQKFKLDRLSTFGRLAHLKQDVIGGLLDDLFRLRLIEQTETERFRPVVHLTPLGWEVIRGQRAMDWNTTLSASLRGQLNGGLARRESSPAPPAPPKARLAADPFAARPAADRPAFYWTWRLLASGLTPAECQAALGLGHNLYLDHLHSADAAGLVVDRNWSQP